MFWGMQDFDFAQISHKFWLNLPQISSDLPKFAQKSLLGLTKSLPHP